MGKKVKVKVPATSANLGPGFDCLGLALNLYNEIEFERIGEGVEIISKYSINNPEDNLVYRSFKKAMKYMKKEDIPIKITEYSNIPSARGLGSSAACIVGGIVGAGHICERELSQKEIIEIGTEIEGHPDNIAPAVYGGGTASFVREDDIYTSQFQVNPKIGFIALVPDFKLSTSKARAVLPEKVSYEDAIFNLSRTAMLLLSLIKGEKQNLKGAFEDRLHQPYRGKLIPDYQKVMTYLDENDDVLGSYISGAGPTIMTVISTEDTKITDEIKNFASTLSERWEIMNLTISQTGAEVVL